jgi:hypothetical protein
MKRPAFLFSILYLFFSLSLHAQSAAEIEGLLSEKTITCEQAAYLTLAAAMAVPREEAFAVAHERGWIRQKLQGEDPVTAGDLSLLIMKAFDINGGLMYRLTGSRRYAFREMKHHGIFPGRSYPNQLISGEQFLQILDDITEGKHE